MPALRWTHCCLFALLVGMLWCGGCVPSYSAFLRLTVQRLAPTSGTVGTARILLSEVRERMPSFDPDDAAYYFRGREPLAHRYEDTDGDGERDVVIVDLPPNATDYWVVIVSPK